MPVAVRGLTQLTRLFNQAPADVKRAYRAELRTVGEPVRASAERLAVSGIRKVGPNWSRMRTGVTTRLVYVAPRERGAKGRGNQSRRRPNMGSLLRKRALEPALEQNKGRIEADFARMLDRLAAKWNRIGS
jgi:hypothetical protein